MGRLIGCTERKPSDRQGGGCIPLSARAMTLTFIVVYACFAHLSSWLRRHGCFGPPVRKSPARSGEISFTLTINKSCSVQPRLKQHSPLRVNQSSYIERAHI